jgi:hypothetical protein
VPVLYLQKLSDLSALEDDAQKSKVILGTIDIKDAFLMMEQPFPMVVTLWARSIGFERTYQGNAWVLRAFETISISKHGLQVLH